ncbi:MAG: hypothetical protein FK734_16960 [Asgard group archaeon]|nr:hypothetical protein [Asgard group archaeon]
MNNHSLKSSNSTKRITYVLDASAIYNGVLSRNITGFKYIAECTIDEIKNHFRGEAFLQEISLYDDVIIFSTKLESIQFIRNEADKTGDIEELSNCDIEILAIAYELTLDGQSVTIISDDYDIQNLAKYLKISYRGIHWKGITHLHTYYWVCTGCGKKSQTKLENCFDCGSLMIRKTIKKKMK